MGCVSIFSTRVRGNGRRVQSTACPRRGVPFIPFTENQDRPGTSGANPEMTQDQIWNELEVQEKDRAAQRENQRVLREADKLERDYNLLLERARELVRSEGIERGGRSQRHTPGSGGVLGG